MRTTRTPNNRSGATRTDPTRRTADAHEGINAMLRAESIMLDVTEELARHIARLAIEVDIATTELWACEARRRALQRTPYRQTARRAQAALDVAVAVAKSRATTVKEKTRFAPEMIR